MTDIPQILPSLLIADDDPVVCSMLAAQLSASFEIVAGAGDAQEAIDMAVALQPDVALIDVQMPKGGGLRATHEIHERSPSTAVVAFSADESDRTVREMITAGAITYLRKDAPGLEMAPALHRSIEAHDRLTRRRAASAVR